MLCTAFSRLLEGEVDKESKAFGLQLSLSRRGVRKRDDPVLFHTALVPEAERQWRLGCTWRDWAGPRSTRETHNVSFVLNDCAVGTGLPLSSCCLLSAVKCGNDFCLWLVSRFFWEKCIFPLSFSGSVSLFHLHLPSLHLIRVKAFVNSLEICMESGVRHMRAVGSREWDLIQFEGKGRWTVLMEGLSSCSHIYY